MRATRRWRNSTSPASASQANPSPAPLSLWCARCRQQTRKPMSEYQLYCFAQSGNAYRAALMLNLIGADWKPQWLDFFNAGVQRKPEFREGINEMGEVPV